MAAFIEACKLAPEDATHWGNLKKVLKKLEPNGKNRNALEFADIIEKILANEFISDTPDDQNKGRKFLILLVVEWEATGKIDLKAMINSKRIVATPKETRPQFKFWLNEDYSTPHCLDKI